jgi:hypothetical protein
MLFSGMSRQAGHKSGLDWPASDQMSHGGRPALSPGFCWSAWEYETRCLPSQSHFPRLLDALGRYAGATKIKGMKCASDHGRAPIVTLRPCAGSAGQWVRAVHRHRGVMSPCCKNVRSESGRRSSSAASQRVRSPLWRNHSNVAGTRKSILVLGDSCWDSLCLYRRGSRFDSDRSDETMPKLAKLINRHRKIATRRR